MSDLLWPILTLGAYCFGVTTGIAWAAAWRPGRVELRVEVACDEG